MTVERDPRDVAIDALVKESDALNRARKDIDFAIAQLREGGAPDKRKHKCQTCGVAFVRDDQLADHRALVHGDD